MVMCQFCINNGLLYFQNKFLNLEFTIQKAYTEFKPIVDLEGDGICQAILAKTWYMSGDPHNQTRSFKGTCELFLFLFHNSISPSFVQQTSFPFLIYWF